MVVYSLADFIAQLCLARWEEEYHTSETLEVGPHDRISYARFLCAGQEVRFTICASAKITASIGLDDADDGLDRLPILSHRNVSCITMAYGAKRTAWYLLRILNESSRSISIAVEIWAAKRHPSSRTRLEAVVNRFIRAE